MKYLIALSILVAVRPGIAQTVDVEMFYDQDTGNVWLDASDMEPPVVTDLVFGTHTNELRPENFRAPFLDNGINTDREAFQIGQSDPLNQGVGPILNLGRIFPVGIATTRGELADYLRVSFTFAEWGNRLATRGGGFGFRFHELNNPIGPPPCGDFDLEHQFLDVDSADRTIQTQNWTGALMPGEHGKEFYEGDCDGDTDVDTFDQIGLIQNWTGAQMMESETATIVVPEPNTLHLMLAPLCALVAWLRIRVRR